MSKSKTHSQWHSKAAKDLRMLSAYTDTPRAEISARITRRLAKFGPIYPPHWITQLAQTRCKCGACKGSGVYSRGIHNGKPTNDGVCYKCQGTGKITLEDAYRSQKAIEMAAMRACP